MNQQEIFNKVWRKYMVRGDTQSVANMECMYRGPDGAKCAIGELIPDKIYDSKMEKKNIHSLLYPDSIVRNNTLRKFFEVEADTEESKKKIEFLSRIQYAHDYTRYLDLKTFHKHVRAILLEIASDYNLELL